MQSMNYKWYGNKTSMHIDVTSCLQSIYIVIICSSYMKLPSREANPIRYKKGHWQTLYNIIMPSILPVAMKIDYHNSFCIYQVIAFVSTADL